MKKILALVLAAMMLLGMCSAMAEAPEGYPEVIEGLDFGGRTVYIYDWWGNDDAEHSTRQAEPDAETQALYDYRDWLEATYNVKIVETALSDWAGNPAELTNINMNGGLNGKGDEGDWCIIAIAADFAPATLKNDLYMPWTIDLSAEKWNPVTTNFMTKDGKVLGVHVGKTEPRSCLFFNKRVLEEAGIDWNTIYDMQADGTWTWEAWENIMDQVQRDTDNDGIIDIYGLTGSGDDMAVALVFANGASFFDKDENGKITLAVDSQPALDALEERVLEINDYIRRQGLMPFDLGDLFTFKSNYCMVTAPECNVLIDAEGDLYACDAMPENMHYGNVKTGINQEAWDKVAAPCGVREECTSCVFLPHCTEFDRCPNRTEYDACYRQEERKLERELRIVYQIYQEQKARKEKDQRKCE